MPGRPIGFFDSGEGGLTVMREVARLLPGEDLIYACDTAHFPYGPRPLSEVRRLFLRFVAFFAEENCKLVVVACNTATVAALDLLDSGLSVPAIGVVRPGAEAAAAASRSGVIGVAATQGTVQSGIYPRLIAHYRPDARVEQQPCPILVIRAEAGVISGPEVRAEVERCLRPLLAQGMDTLVLGCTHFPHMRAVIADVAGPDVVLVDPGQATAILVAQRLRAANLVSAAPVGRYRFYTSGDPASFVRTAARLWPDVVCAADPLPLTFAQE